MVGPLVLLSVLSALTASASATRFTEIEYSCIYDTSTHRAHAVANQHVQTAAAWARYDGPSVNRTGWAKLRVETNRDAADWVQMRSAGFCEGFASWEQILWSKHNFYMNNGWVSGSPPAFVNTFLKTNWAWTMAQAEKHWNGRADSVGGPDDRRFWTHTYLVLQQIQGMYEGFVAAAPPSVTDLTLFDIFVLQTQGDTETLASIEALANTGVPESDFVDVEAGDWNPIFHEHCSSLTKVTDDGQDLFAGHATWSGWGTFGRSYKSYVFRLSNNTRGPHDERHAGVSFSAYPGTISSIDDWYVTSQNIVITETTNGIFNKTMLKSIKPESILSWLRVVVANRLAVDGEEWTRLFAIDNSGTYNNQWIVVDYNKFEPSANGKFNKDLKPGTLWIAEQVPGLLERADVTHVLNEQGFWPSYNIPYFPNIFQSSGFPSMVEKYGQWFSYAGSPRAKIFAREQGKVNSFGRYQFLMRYNEWQTDPVANGNAGNGIASRFDLVTQQDPSNPFLKKACFGAMDAKTTSYELMKFRAAEAISGPTFYQQSAFNFDAPICSTVYHVGTPQEFNFGWEHFRV